MPIRQCSDSDCFEVKLTWDMWSELRISKIHDAHIPSAEGWLEDNKHLRDTAEYKEELDRLAGFKALDAELNNQFQGKGHLKTAPAIHLTQPDIQWLGWTLEWSVGIWSWSDGESAGMLRAGERALSDMRSLGIKVP